MTSSLQIPNVRKAGRGFTLTELLIAIGLSGLILAGVMSSFLLIGKSGYSLGSYASMEAQARLSLEQFAQDVRQASAIKWNSADSIVLTVQGAAVSYQLVEVGKDLQFQRNGRALVTGVVPESFSLIPYTLAGHIIPFTVDADTEQPDPTADELADAERMTKQLQLSLQAARTRTTVATATNTVLSARFILRNKKVT